MLDVVTFHSQPISFNALLSIMLKFQQVWKGFWRKNFWERKYLIAPNLRLHSKICALVFANMKNWRSDHVLSWRSENLYSTYETWDLFQAFLHLQKTTGQRFCLELLKLCTTYETCLKHWSKIKLSQKFQKFGQIMKLQTCFKNFAPARKNKKKPVRDFVWNFWNFVNLWNLKHFAPQQNNWSEFGLELLKLCETYETLKLVVSSILHLEKKLVKDVVWNFWNFAQLMKLQSCFKHVASFF